MIMLQKLIYTCFCDDMIIDCYVQNYVNFYLFLYLMNIWVPIIFVIIQEKYLAFLE